MQIKTLDLTDFKKHALLNLQFESGSNLITGPNYAGKSTILRAIFIALFGNSVDPTKSAKMVRRGASDFKIDMVFGNLRVVRTLKESSLERLGEEPYARGHTAVNKAILDELGLEKDAFMKVFASEQGTPQSLLSMEGAQLQKFIESLVGIGDIDGVTRKVKKKLADDKARCEYMLENMLPDVDSLIEELEQAKLRQQENEVTSAASQNKFESLKQERESLLASMKEAMAYNARYSKWAAAKEALAAEGYALPVRDTAELEQKLAVENTSLDTLYSAWSAYNQKLISISSLEKGITRLTDRSRQLQQVIDAPTAEIYNLDDLIKQVGETTNLLNDSKRKLVDLKSLLDGASCPTCKRAFDSDFDEEASRAEMAKLKEESQTLSTTLVALNKDFDAKVTHNSKVSRQADKIEEAEQELKGLLNDLEEMQFELTGLQSNLGDEPKTDEQRSLVKSLDDELKAILSDNRVAITHNQRLAKLQESVDSLYSDEFGLGARETASIEAAVADCNKAFDLLMVDSQTLSKSMSANTALIQSLSSRISAHQKTQADHERTTKRMGLLEKIANVLVQSRAQLIDDAYRKVFLIAAEFTRACTDGDISDVLMTEDGIAYVEDGKEFDKTEASGAQKSIIGLGMKLGMAQLLAGRFDSLLLDEISADMSEEISMRCMLALSAYCGQSIAVTHRQEDVGGNVITL